MNNLSWAIYLGEVMPKLAEAVFILTSILTIFCCVVYYVYLVELNKSYSPEERKEYRKSNKTTLKYICICLVVLFLITLIPSKQTFYLIFASEASEEMVVSEEGQEILNDIKEVLRLNLEKLKE